MKKSTYILVAILSSLFLQFSTNLALGQTKGTTTASMRVSVNILEPASIELVKSEKIGFINHDYSSSAVIANDMTVGFLGSSQSDLMVSITAPDFLTLPCGKQATFSPNIHHLNTNSTTKLESGKKFTLCFGQANEGNYRSLEKININGSIETDSKEGQFTGTYIVKAEYN